MKRHVIPTRRSRRARLLGALVAVSGSPLALMLFGLAAAAVVVVWGQP
jgi:hypothetical protein